MSCNDDSFREGGTYKDPYIIGGKATETELNNCSLTGGVTIDQECAEDIAAAIQTVDLPAVADTPASTLADNLPLTVIGERVALLGKPAAFIKCGSFMIPVYKAEGV